MELYEIIMFAAIIIGILMVVFRGSFVLKISEFFGGTFQLSSTVELIAGIILIVGGFYYMKKYTTYLKILGLY